QSAHDYGSGIFPLGVDPFKLPSQQLIIKMRPPNMAVAQRIDIEIFMIASISRLDIFQGLRLPLFRYNRRNGMPPLQRVRSDAPTSRTAHIVCVSKSDRRKQRLGPK